MRIPITPAGADSLRVRRGALCAAVSLVLACFVPSGSAHAATWERLGGGTISLPASAWTLDEDIYRANDCATNTWNGNVAAVITVTAYEGKWLEVRFEGTSQSFGAPQLLARGDRACAPFGGGLAFSEEVAPKFKFRVTDVHHLTLSYTGPAAGLRYSVWRCTSTLC